MTWANDTFSSWEKITAGVPQGFLLGPSLFNIFTNEIFLFVNKVFLSNYAGNKVQKQLLEAFLGLEFLFFKKRLQHGCFPVKFTKFLRTPILKNIWERLLLKVLYAFRSNPEEIETHVSEDLIKNSK